jgi:hypothetical protein
MIEYPKRLYRAGKGYTVNNLEEEQAFLNPLPAAEVPTIDNEVRVETTGTEEEALEYIISKGYGKKAARSILKKEGLEAILAAKAEGTDPQE